MMLPYTKILIVQAISLECHCESNQLIRNVIARAINQLEFNDAQKFWHFVNHPNECLV
jgi:hypothetical protein